MDWNRNWNNGIERTFVMVLVSSHCEFVSVLSSQSSHAFLHIYNCKIWQRNVVRKYLQLCSLWLQTTVALYPGPVLSQAKQRVSLKGRSGWVWLTLHFSWMDRFLSEAPTEVRMVIKAHCSWEGFSGGFEGKEGSIRYWEITWLLIQAAECLVAFWFRITAHNCI